MKKLLLYLLLILSFCLVACNVPDDPVENPNPVSEDDPDPVKDPESPKYPDSPKQNPPKEEDPPKTLDKTYYVKVFEAVDEINFDAVEKAMIDTYKWVDNSATYNAYGQLVYIKNYGFICKLTCYESNPKTTYENDNDPVYKDSALEFFFSLGDEGYMNLESNSIGARIQEFGNKPNRKSVFLTLEGGFVPVIDKQEDQWTLTYTFTLENLKLFYPTLEDNLLIDGFEFRGNFYKIGTIDGKSHYGMWREIDNKTAQFHMPNQFGYFILKEDK